MPNAAQKNTRRPRVPGRLSTLTLVSVSSTGFAIRHMLADDALPDRSLALIGSAPARYSPGRLEPTTPEHFG